MVRQVPEGRQAGHDDPAVGLAAFGRSWESLAALAPAGLVGLAASADEGPYVVTELLEGATLRDRLRDALSLKRTLDPRQIATGLAAAQAKGTGHWGVEVSGGAEISLSAPRSLASNLNLNYRVAAVKGELDVFLNVQNLFNKKPPPANFYGTMANTGQFGGWATSDDIVGRYYTAGARYKF